jgi:hypothetical protein
MRRLWMFALIALLPLGAQKLAQRNDGEEHGDPPYLTEDGWRPLFNGRDFAGWHGQDDKPHQWLATRGVIWERLLGPTRLSAVPLPGDRMLNGPQGRTLNLVTDEKFGDLELYLEFILAKGSNSGVYLHGLYQIQVFDSFGSVEPMTTSDPRATPAAVRASGSPSTSGFRPRGSTRAAARSRTPASSACSTTGSPCNRTSNWKAPRGRTWTSPRLP